MKLDRVCVLLEYAGRRRERPASKVLTVVGTFYASLATLAARLGTRTSCFLRLA